jgi:hypothetical protein
MTPSSSAQVLAPASLGDGDLPQALTIDFIDGYFVWAIRDGRVFFSGINDKTVSALDFGKAESHPGGIYRAVAFGEMLLSLRAERDRVLAERRQRDGLSVLALRRSSLAASLARSPSLGMNTGSRP